MSEIPKAYEPQSVEAKWYQFWLDQKCFTADPASVKPAYSIVIPPPNVTGVLTLGHVLNNTIQDILARKARMDGKEVLWLPGMDHAGIATQTVVERTLKKAGEIKHRNDLGREKFLEKIWEWKEKHGGIILQQLQALGASCDWTRTRFTMDPEYSQCVSRVFVDLYKKGMIYRGKRMVNWCPVSLTALSDEEVTMKEQKGFMYHFKVEVVDCSGDVPSPSAVTDRRYSAGAIQSSGVFLTIATTRPETIPGDTAVAVNPKDPRYAHLIGKYVLRPLPSELPREQKLIPIVGDEHVDFAFGTGVLKVTPAHDKADFDIGQRHQLPVVEVINADGSMNELAGADLQGLDRFKARKVAVEKLTELGALEKEEPYTNNVGYSERADVPIEPRLSEQWFLKYPSVEKARNCVGQPDSSFAQNVSEKTARVVKATGTEFEATTIRELRKAASGYARTHGFLGVPFRNEDSGIEIRLGRQSLSHAFSHIGVVNIQAIAVLPELIKSAIWISSQPHKPSNPIFKKVHRFIAALELAGANYAVAITAKEFADGTVLYDHRAKKITPGGKSLEAHLPKEKLDTQPAPSVGLKVSELLSCVNELQRMHFHPERWAKVYDHWMTGLQDWCISRQLWWGHRIPVWHKRVKVTEKNWVDELLPWGWDEWVEGNWQRDAETDSDETTFVRMVRVSDGKEVDPKAQPMTPALQQDEGEYDVYIATLSKDLATNFGNCGFIQDPDVLDTWFSSWLWPFATMGWPEKTETLKKFYPTTDLVTGPDIIFFWVARMIMAGYEWMGEMPFRNVYFTGIIRDKQGRKMSKSLGNSPDPLDLISRFGADALRFGIMRSAPAGQDLLFDEQAVELGRNFANKLWNACRFRQMQGGETEGELRPELLTSDDKWILLKLDAAIREVTSALNEYKFNDAANTLYRFFWGEFCDWYLEAAKATLGAPGGQVAAAATAAPEGQPISEADQRAAARRANTVAVIDLVLSHTLRLFHPFMPFITEELWHGMGFHQDLPEDQGGRTIMFSHWPQPFDADFKDFYGIDDCYLDRVDAKYELVRQGRNLRREANVSAAKKVTFILRQPEGISPHDCAVIALLLNAEEMEVSADYQPEKATPVATTPLGELFLPLAGVIDAQAEIDRLNREREKVVIEIGKVEQKLANPSFTQKVPAAVLADHQKRLADWQARQQQLDAAIDGLKALLPKG